MAEINLFFNSLSFSAPLWLTASLFDLPWGVGWSWGIWGRVMDLEGLLWDTVLEKRNGEKWSWTVLNQDYRNPEKWGRGRSAFPMLSVQWKCLWDVLRLFSFVSITANKCSSPKSQRALVNSLRKIRGCNDHAFLLHWVTLLVVLCCTVHCRHSWPRLPCWH